MGGVTPVRGPPQESIAAKWNQVALGPVEYEALRDVNAMTLDIPMRRIHTQTQGGLAAIS
jgi:hypothetical protein